MRFRVEIREGADGMRAVVVDATTDQVVAVAETVRDAERVAATFERRLS